MRRPYLLTFLYSSLPLLPEDVIMQDLTPIPCIPGEAVLKIA